MLNGNRVHTTRGARLLTKGLFFVSFSAAAKSVARWRELAASRTGCPTKQADWQSAAGWQPAPL